MAKHIPRSLRTLALFLLSGIFLFSLAGCSPQSFTTANGIVARDILDLHIIIFWLSLVVFFGVELLIIWVVWRYRRRPGQAGIPNQVHGNTRLEVVWSIIPVIIVAILAVPTVRLIGQFTSIPNTPDTVRVRVVAHQWWWEFHYPDLNFATSDELHIPVGRPIALDLESADVIHSFWVPKLSGTLDTIPGRVNRIWLRADDPGIYWGQCKEFCGSSHALMKFRVIAQPREEFDTWVRQHQAPPGGSPTGNTPEAQGALIFGSVKLPEGQTPPAGSKMGVCAACHTIDGTQAQGKVGPNLTLFGERTSIAAGILPNTNEDLRAWLKDPPGVKPGSKMPNYDLTDQELDALVAYLMSLSAGQRQVPTDRDGFFVLPTNANK
jgi:cytochrome c oxidase subunit 2